MIRLAALDLNNDLWLVNKIRHKKARLESESGFFVNLIAFMLVDSGSSPARASTRLSRLNALLKQTFI